VFFFKGVKQWIRGLLRVNKRNSLLWLEDIVGKRGGRLAEKPLEIGLVSKLGVLPGTGLRVGQGLERVYAGKENLESKEI